MSDDKSISINRFEWLEKIVLESSVKIEQVENILNKYDIQAQSTLPIARKIQIKAIKFDGVKQGTLEDGKFSFDWVGLSSGLWGVVSDKNLRGKSSILNICHAALQGDFPGRIQDDVWFWLSNLEVNFKIDSIDYLLRLKKKSGDSQIAGVLVMLCRHINGEDSILYKGAAGDELKEAISRLFMNELKFDNFYAFNKKYNIRKSHGWSAISSALFISQESGALFGDHMVDGLPLRLLQIFIGLPWVSTYTAVTTSLKQFEILDKDSTKAGQDKNIPSYFMHELERLEKEKISLESKKPIDVVKRSFIRSELVSLDKELVEIQRKFSSSNIKLANHENELTLISDRLIDVKRTLQQLKDEEASGYLFRKLRPQCCPVCEADIVINNKKHPDEDGSCILCGKAESSHEELFDERIEIVAEEVHKYCNLKKTLEEEVLKVQKYITELEKNKKVLQDDIIKFQNQLVQHDGMEIERELVSISAKIDMLNYLITQNDMSKELAENNSLELDYTVLKAIEKETKLAFEELQIEVLNDVSVALTRYVKNLGMVNIKSVTLNTRGHLYIEKGGVATTFSKLTAGEKLRVRIAIALAVIDVAKERGYGRHPSLLILDSPAAQEMSPEDFGALLVDLQKIIRDKSDLQIIVGAVAQKELLSVISKGNLKRAEGNGYLF